MKKDNKKFIKHDNSKVINHNKDLYDVKKVTNSKDALEAIKKANKGECIIYDEATQERDQFKVSFGNIDVLKNIPEMMLDQYWRRELRKLVLDYLNSKVKRELITKGYWY